MKIREELEEARKHIGKLSAMVEQGLSVEEEEHKMELEDLLDEIVRQLDEFEQRREELEEEEREKPPYYFNYAYNGVSERDFF